MILCITVAFIFKVGNVMSYFQYQSSKQMENVASNDAAEKEEKKVETEYFTEQFSFIGNNLIRECTPQKPIVPLYFSKLSYFPEVLTPPPSA